jgi:ribosomal protein L32
MHRVIAHHRVSMMQRKDQKRAHLFAMSVTQDLEKRSTIGVLEISTRAAYLFSLRKRLACSI